MKYIANIVTSSKKTVYNQFYKICRNLDEIDDALPTLVIGVSNAKKSFDNINYIKRQIDEKTFWTYGMTEKRSTYEQDIENFNNFVLKNIKDEVKYVYINSLTSTLSYIKRFLKYIMKNSVSCFIMNRMIYISYENNVFGISLDELEYIGINKTKLYTKIKQNIKYIITDRSEFYSTNNDFFKNDNIVLSAMFCYLNT